MAVLGPSSPGRNLRYGSTGSIPWGDWGVFRNFAIASKKQRAGVVVLTNSFNGPRVYQEIVSAAVGRDHPSLEWVQGYRP
jgi:hypothetical protein